MRTCQKSWQIPNPNNYDVQNIMYLALLTVTESFLSICFDYGMVSRGRALLGLGLNPKLVKFPPTNSVGGDLMCKIKISGKGFNSGKKNLNQEMTHSCITVKYMLYCVLFTAVTVYTHDPSYVRVLFM